VALARDGRAAVYMGDDAPFEYLYKFVTAESFDAENPRRNRDLLDRGTLYVARFRDDGTGEWLPLVWGEQPALGAAAGFASQGDVVLRCREAADLLGATPLDRPEDVAVSPTSGKVYLSCTENTQRTGEEVEAEGRRLMGVTDAVSPRGPNAFGHVLELTEDGNDPGATRFRWEIFLLAGDPAGGRLLATLDSSAAALSADACFFAGDVRVEELSAFAGPDNLGFDARGNLWIVTDGDQPGGTNNGCFTCPAAGPERGRVRQFMSGPVGAEICGCEFAPGGDTLFLSIQHPGAGGSALEPTSHWPDGGSHAPRPSLIAITSDDPGRAFGS
jgi:secreted PhoX family phosphatase